MSKEMELLAVKAPKVLVQAIDELATRQFRSRSDIIRQGVLRELEACGLIPLNVRPAE